MNTRIVLMSLVLAVVMVGAGLGIGYLLFNGSGPAATGTPPNQTAGSTQLAKDLSSRVFPSISASGTIASINGKNIVVKKDADSVTIAIADDAKVFAFTTGAKGVTTSKAVTLGQLKVGDNVSIGVRVAANGAMQGISVVVLPPPK